MVQLLLLHKLRKDLDHVRYTINNGLVDYNNGSGYFFNSEIHPRRRLEIWRSL